MISRTDVSRAIRNLTDGPRRPAGRVAREVAICDEAEALPEASAGADGLPRLGARLQIEAGPDGARLWMARVGEAVHLPRMGAIVDNAGRLLRASANEVDQYDPGFRSFPYFRRREGRLSFSPPEDAPRFGPSTVWLPFHATYNYGHFILDALPSLLAAEELGALGRMPAITPPLKPWQEALLGLAFGERLPRERTPAFAVRLDEALYASSMDNFLHAPAPIVARLRERMLARVPAERARGPRRVYLSRRGWSMRVMLNEAQVEAALRARGFETLQPEGLSVVEQAALMRDAEVVVAPTGAGLANAFFAPVEARVIEIKPLGFGGPWVSAFRRVLGGGCTVLTIPEAAPRREVPLRHRLRLGFRFAYETPMDELLAAVDAAL